ncbi:hypothetical protein ACHAXR_007139 [Thalassiosira sp. AJA248-18]
MADYRNQQQPEAADISSRRASGLYQNQPTRIKSFFRQNNNNAARKIIVPLLYLFLGALYFYTLLFRDVGSGLHVLKDNNIVMNLTQSTAPLWNSNDASSNPVAYLEPRSLADVTIANSEVAWKRQMDHQNYLTRRAEMKKRREDASNKMQKENGTMIDDSSEEHADLNATEQLMVLKLPNSTKLDKSEAEEYVLSVKRTPKRRKKIGEGKGGDIGFLPVLIMITTCTIFRVIISVLIGQTADNLDSLVDSDGEEDTTDTTTPTTGGRRRGGLSSFMTGLSSGGREAARLRRRARVVRANRQFQRFVDRLNAEREANGERQISADTLRHLVNARDFNGNDYDRLHTFAEENGAAVGSFFSAMGATEAEINRCPSRSLEAGDDLLVRSRTTESGGGGDQHHQHQKTCSVCLEPYQIGETVRTIPCFHTFHTACIDPWLAQRAECPVCKHSAIG